MSNKRAPGRSLDEWMELVTENLYEFKTEEELYQAVEEFSYVHYNHVRPHSSNGYRTPYQARIAG